MPQIYLDTAGDKKAYAAKEAKPKGLNANISLLRRGLRNEGRGMDRSWMKLQGGSCLICAARVLSVERSRLHQGKGTGEREVSGRGGRPRST